MGRDTAIMVEGGGGTGQKLASVTTVVAGVASLVATLVSIVSIILQAKNYRKPLLQRYVVRILLMVPIYSIASWTSMVSLSAAAFLDPIRDIYEAFTIYTFFQLLINYLGGERSMIIMTHGRAPVQHLWPLNHVLAKVDISDPHTFLSVKRGILQYAWLKPILAFTTIIMKATGTYQEGYLGLSSGYMWSGIIYNISVTMSLYSLGLFWVCMHKDLTPFRPVPKFLCIKLIIFASYWQGFLLSILVFVGAIPDDVPEYSPDNLAAAIQDALICVEMPAFAIAHWYAFSWHDFADNSILSARMHLNFAFRDAFGIRDLIEDSKETFRGDNYGYRSFDSGDKVMAHEDSKSRLARLRDGMRYERGGKGKYWIPKPGEVNTTTPLLGSNGGSNGDSGSSSRADQLNDHTNGTFDEPEIDPEEDSWYEAARELEYGDWNYPVITASEPLSERYMSRPGNYRRSTSRTTTSSTPKAGVKSPGAGSSRAQEPEPEPVIPVKKKKRTKKLVKHEEPDVSHLHLEAESSSTQQAPTSEAAAHQYDGNRSPDPETTTAQNQHTGYQQEQEQEQEQEERDDDISPRYQVEDSEEFRNVWGSFDRSK